tara:strand:+ start:69 stop:203 length:135 start_codon:yes stop_codon:yes gene_type:complete
MISASMLKSFLLKKKQGKAAYGVSQTLLPLNKEGLEQMLMLDHS